MTKSKSDTVQLLINIGAIISIVLAVLSICGLGWGWGFGSYIFDIIWSIVIIVIFALGLLFATGLIKKWFVKIPTTWVVLLIVGLLILIPTSNWGGVLIIVAAFYDKFA